MPSHIEAKNPSIDVRREAADSRAENSETAQTFTDLVLLRSPPSGSAAAEREQVEPSAPSPSRPQAGTHANRLARVSPTRAGITAYDPDDRPASNRSAERSSRGGGFKLNARSLLKTFALAALIPEVDTPANGGREVGSTIPPLDHGHCPALPCATASDLIADQILSDARSSPSGGGELPFCRSTLLDLAGRAQHLQESGLPAIEHIQRDALGGQASRGNGRGFGLEIEFGFGPGLSRAEIMRRLDALNKDLCNLGLIDRLNVRVLHGGRDEGYTSQLADGAIEPDGEGGEYVSSILFDEPETWSHLDRVLDAIRAHGGVITPDRGGHVHVGVAEYRGRVDVLCNLIGLVNRYEDILHRLGGPSLSGHPFVPVRYAGTSSINHFPEEPILRDLDNRRGLPTIDERPASLEQLKSLLSSRYVTLNLAGVHGDEKDHVEFRIPDGSLDLAVIQVQAMVYTQMVAKALELADKGEVVDATGAKRLGSHFESFGLGPRTPSGRSLTSEDIEQLSQMLDELAFENVQKSQIASLFALRDWQPSESYKDPRAQNLNMALVVFMAAVVTMLGEGHGPRRAS